GRRSRGVVHRRLLHQEQDPDREQGDQQREQGHHVEASGALSAYDLRRAAALSGAHDASSSVRRRARSVGRQNTSTTSKATPWTTSSANLSGELGPSTACGSTGVSTCQVRVAALSVPAWPRPSVASSPAATRPSNGSGRTMYLMPAAARSSTT